MKEALKYQKTTVIFIDVYTTTYSKDYMPADNNSTNLDTMKMNNLHILKLMKFGIYQIK